jgi:hypothetical protein
MLLLGMVLVGGQRRGRDARLPGRKVTTLTI